MTSSEPFPVPTPADGHVTVADVLAGSGVSSVFQPIVDLETGEVVAMEALARGPRGSLQAPDALLAAARSEGLLSELDEACRRAAFRGAVERGIANPLAVFVNVEPEVLDAAPLDDLVDFAARGAGGLRVVVEITERALTSRPAELLRTVERVRDLGWKVALDDVGAEPASLAFMSLLRPDVVKLDLSLVQERPSPAVAEIMNAVNAYAEDTGAVLLAEGIETPARLAVARGLGATLGQGWLFGKPTASPLPQPAVRPLLLDVDHASSRRASSGSPFGCLPDDVVLRRAPKRLLIELSKQIERHAMGVGQSAVIASTFQHVRYVTPATRQRYRELVHRIGFVVALGEGLVAEPMPGVRGADLADDDLVRGEWDVVVISPHFTVALLAHDLGDTGPEMDRMFEFALTYQRPTAVRAARELLSRVVAKSSDPDPMVVMATVG